VIAAGIWTLELASPVWLAVGSLTALGARRRGQGWRFAWLSGLFFPLSWGDLVRGRRARGRRSRDKAAAPGSSVADHGDRVPLGAAFPGRTRQRVHLGALGDPKFPR
jgi:hypothetical protein